MGLCVHFTCCNYDNDISRYKMKWWSLLMLLGLLQVVVFVDTCSAKSRDSDGDGLSDEDDHDDDNDGIPDDDDSDADGDGIPDHADKDRDSDGDGIADADNDDDDDNDGIPDDKDTDDDGDGVLDEDDEDHEDYDNDEL